MRSTTIITVFLAGAISSANAVGIFVCREARWGGGCTTLTAGIGQCIWVDHQYNDHVYSARAAPGSMCDSYEHVVGGACRGLLVSGIDEAGYSGLPYGHKTSGFVCRNA